jgi:hypothetical protein
VVLKRVVIWHKGFDAMARHQNIVVSKRVHPKKIKGQELPFWEGNAEFNLIDTNSVLRRVQLPYRVRYYKFVS